MRLLARDSIREERGPDHKMSENEWSIRPTTPTNVKPIIANKDLQQRAVSDVTIKGN